MIDKRRIDKASIVDPGGSEATSHAHQRPYHHGNLPDALIDAGIRMLKARGPHKFSLRELSENVGVTRTAPAHHFGDRNGLLAAIAAKGYQQLVKLRNNRIANTGDDVREKLIAAAASYVEFALSEPELFTLMFSTIIVNRDKYPDLVTAQRAAFYGLAGYVQELFEASEDTDVSNVVAYGLWSLMHGISTLKINQPGAPSTIQNIPVNHLSRQLAEVFLEGIRASVTRKG